MGIDYVPNDAERAANVKRNEAQATSARAEAKLFTADARRTVALAEQAEIGLRKAQRDERDELAKAAHFHTYLFDSEVSAVSVKACVHTLSVWARQEPGCSIDLNLNSPGGSIIDGFALIDFLRGLRAATPKHEITIASYGMCASMAGVILQAADRRVLGQNAVMLIHEGSFGAAGDYASVLDRVELMQLLHERILDLFAERSVMSRANIRKHWTRKDWWLSAADALKNGFCDEVA
jgi:ATP-dependent protease ClpP protease subunit